MKTSFASRQQARHITRAGVQVCCLRLRAFRGLYPPTSAAEGWGPPPLPSLPFRRAPPAHSPTSGSPTAVGEDPSPGPTEDPGHPGHLPRDHPEAVPGGPPPQAYHMITLDQTYVQGQTSVQGSNTCTSPPDTPRTTALRHWRHLANPGKPLRHAMYPSPSTPRDHVRFPNVQPA